MELLTILYLSYTFIAFYFLFIYVLTYFQNNKQMYEAPFPNKMLTLSIIIPCFNGGKNIGKTIQGHLSSDYSALKKIIVVDDCSTDNSALIIKEYEKKYEQVMYVKTPENTGNAAGAKNYGSQFVKTALIGFSDDDSVPRKNAISKMVGFFNDEKVGAVTSRVLTKGNKNFLVKSQSIEYKVIAFTRKILGFLDSIYVTNGPLSIYRKKAFNQVGGFDKNNLTEDIEITWHFVSKGWKVQMSIPSIVYTYPPTTVRDWFHQRIRWNVGGIQTVSKYRKIFMECGMLGFFILPYFIFSWVLGITGLFFLSYRFSQYVTMKYLVAKYSIAANIPIITSNNFSLNPSILFFFGIIASYYGITVYNYRSYVF